MVNTGKERVRAVFHGQSILPPCCGELWLGEKLFRAAQLKDDLEGHLQLCGELGMDIVSLPIGESAPSSPYDLYRRFQPNEIAQVTTGVAFAVAVIIDGHFQRLANDMGLMPLLASLKSDTESITSRLSNEADAVNALIVSCTKSGIEAVIIADDIAYSQSTYMNQADIRQFLLPHYAQFVSRIHSGGSYALFHSDGNLTSLIPDLVAIGFDGIAGGQSECMDLVSLKRRWGHQLTIWGGLDQGILDAETLTPTQRDQFLAMVKSLAPGGKFILGSSSGLYSDKHLENIRRLYKLVRKV